MVQRMLHCDVGTKLKKGSWYETEHVGFDERLYHLKGFKTPVASWRFNEAFGDVVKKIGNVGGFCRINGSIDESAIEYHGKVGKILKACALGYFLVETCGATITIKTTACHGIDAQSFGESKEIEVKSAKHKELVNAKGIQNFTEGELYEVEKKGTVYQIIDDLGYKKEVAVWRFDERFIGAVPFNKTMHEVGSMVVINAIGSATIDHKFHGALGVVKDFGGEVVCVDVASQRVICPRTRVLVVDFQQTYDNEVEVVVSYRTKDGKVFTVKSEAISHAENLKRSKVAMQGLEVIKSAGYSEDQISKIQQLLNLQV